MDNDIGTLGKNDQAVISYYLNNVFAVPAGDAQDARTKFYSVLLAIDETDVKIYY